jgi:hypothetical protein
VSDVPTACAGSGYVEMHYHDLDPSVDVMYVGTRSSSWVRAENIIRDKELEAINKMEMEARMGRGMRVGSPELAEW